MGFPRQEYWRVLPFAPPGDLADLGIKPTSPTLTGRFFTWGVQTFLVCVSHSVVSDSL